MFNQSFFGPGNITSSHWLKFNVETNRVCFVLTGVCIVNLKGQDQDWLRQQIIISIAIPTLPAGQGLHIEQWAPLFTLNAVFDQNQAVNGGFAVDDFGINGQVTDPNFGQNSVAFNVNVAMRDSDAFLYRIGYNITLKGSIKPIKPVIIN